MIPVLVVSALASLLGVGLILPILRRAQIMDIPNARSSHEAPTPRGGGLAVVVAVFVGVLVASLRGLQMDPPSVLGVILVFAALGLWDDLHGLNVGFRLLVQLALAGVAAAAVVGEGSLVGLVTMVIATVWLVGYTNAFNFMDGVNGISALNAALAGGWYVYLGIAYGIDSAAILGASVAGAALGFLPWNAPRAQVFLGDVGSYALGVTLGILALLTWHGGVRLIVAIAPLVIYVADTGWALAKRLLAGRAWQQAHREHVYQQFTDSGWPHLAGAALVALFGCLVCLSTLILGNFSPFAVLVLCAGVASVYLASPRILKVGQS